ncbi:hypothetical protein RFI_13285, partial [Reticulomyxa filosa]
METFQRKKHTKTQRKSSPGQKDNYNTCDPAYGFACESGQVAAVPQVMLPGLYPPPHQTYVHEMAAGGCMWTAGGPAINKEDKLLVKKHKSKETVFKEEEKEDEEEEEDISTEANELNNETEEEGGRDDDNDDNENEEEEEEEKLNCAAKLITSNSERRERRPRGHTNDQKTYAGKSTRLPISANTTTSVSSHSHSHSHSKSDSNRSKHTVKMQHEIETLRKHLTQMSQRYNRKLLEYEEIKTKNRDLIQQTKQWKKNYAKLRQQYFTYQEFVVNTYAQKFNKPLTFLSDWRKFLFFFFFFFALLY